MFLQRELRIHRLVFAWAIFLFFLCPADISAQKVGPIKVNASNARAWRDSLKLVLFGTTDFPYSILPETVERNVNVLEHYPVFPYSPILYPAGNLDSVDRISIRISPDLVDFPTPVQAYLFHPHNSNGKLFIYHSGHCVGISTAEDITSNAGGVGMGLVIPWLIAEGYTVLAVPMLNYVNPYPNGYSCGYNNHDWLFADGHYSNPLGLFFRPVIASLNFLGRGNFSDIYMTGLSGGGWSTTLYQAIDTSISYSFPVAGSWPMAVRKVFYPPEGDEEQTYRRLFRDLLDYHEIYALASLAPARKMLQINNRYDNCCFAGAFPHVFYADSVKQALQGSGGVFRFYLDETQMGHQVSPRALQVIKTFLNDDTAFLQRKPQDSITNGFDYFYDIGANFRLNTAPDGSALQYSLLKAPAWLSLDPATGRLTGVVPQGSIFANVDTISFKVEDASGRFVVYDYQLMRKRGTPYFFTGTGDDSTIHFLPQYRNSISSVNPQVASSFYFNDPLLQVTALSIENNSIIKLKVNRAVQATDLIGYNGMSGLNALTYNNGLKLDNFGLSPIEMNVIVTKHAVTAMIRFNTDSRKFEYFNGTAWVNMN